jgi:multidrug efflux pump subunit AcrA (membrane-fusion protein)
MFYRLGILLAIAVLCAALSSCVNNAQPNFERPPAPVVVTTAVAQDVSNYMDALGKIVARETVSIQPQVSGRIITIHFTDGANVKQGSTAFHDRSASLRRKSQTGPSQPR